MHVSAIVRQFAQRVGRPGAVGRGRKAEGGPLPCDASIGRGGSQCAAALRVLTQRRKERCAFSPHQPSADGGDAAIARQLDPVGGVGHLRSGRLKDKPGRADERDRDQRLKQRRHQRHRRAAFERRFIRQHVGGEDRLAVSGARGMHHAIGEAKPDQAPGGAGIAVQRMHFGGHEVGERRLLGHQPAGEPAFPAAPALAARDSKWPLRKLRRRGHDRRAPSGPSKADPYDRAPSSWARDDGGARHFETEIGSRRRGW